LLLAALFVVKHKKNQNKKQILEFVVFGKLVEN